jgi:dTDP-4-dehydrorhamnose reductase
MNVIVTGAAGQLGQALQAAAAAHAGISFYFYGAAEANVADKSSLQKLFDAVKPQYCINAAAYTAVDKAESEPVKAHAINVTGAKNLAEVCAEYGCTLLHISTDFVFDGTAQTPYTEDAATNPQGVYAQTKRDGEAEVIKALTAHFIIRTSWVYSEYGNNFMKTMVRLAQERDALSIVSDQHGTPTNANDLAQALIHIIKSGSKAYGTYHYSNEGETTWYGFAQKIFKVHNITINTKPVTTAEYPTPAKRPAYSVLDKTKIKTTFGLAIRPWQDALTALHN